MELLLVPGALCPEILMLVPSMPKATIRSYRTVLFHAKLPTDLWMCSCMGVSVFSKVPVCVTQDKYIFVGPAHKTGVLLRTPVCEKQKRRSFL